MTDIGKRIKIAREKRGMTQREVAQLLGYQPLAISRWERGERSPSISVLSKLANLLNINIQWLLTGEGEMELPENWPPPGALPVTQVPVYGHVPAGFPETIEATEKPITYIIVPKDWAPPGTIALIVQGNSMEPTLHDGEYILVQPYHTSPKDGDIVVVAQFGGDYTVKELRKTDSRILLIPHNPRYKTIEVNHESELRIVGKVTKVVVYRDPTKDR